MEKEFLRQKNNIELIASENIVSKAVPAKTSMSILQCILVKASNGKITLTANDGDLGIETDKLQRNILSNEETNALFTITTKYESIINKWRTS